MHKRIDEALSDYSNAYFSLKSVVDEYPEYFPSSTLSCGTFAEHYCKIYLQHQYPDALVIFGKGSQRGWDVQVTFSDGRSSRYQIKALSAFAKSRTISALTPGFDVLFVVVLDAGFNPTAAYMFDGESGISQIGRSARLTVPDKRVPSRKGSAIFRNAKDISQEFFEALSEFP